MCGSNVSKYNTNNLNKKDADLAKALQEMFAEIAKKDRSSYNPQAVFTTVKSEITSQVPRSTIGRTMLAGGAEQDAGELLHDIIDALIEQEKKISSGTSSIQTAVQTVLTETVKCTSEHTSSHDETHNILRLTLTPVIGRVGFGNLQENIQNLMSQKTLSGDNQWDCEQCKKKTDATITSSIKMLPRILIIQLNRYANKTEKITDRIDYEQLLHLSDKNYTLKAVINHEGRSLEESGQHYSTTLFKDGKWITVSDTHIRSVSPSLPVSSNAYILLYEAQP